MSALVKVGKEDIRDLLGKGWLTHDGMWFYNTCRELGIAKANQLNKAAIRSMAPYEIKRMKKALRIDGTRIETFDALRDFVREALELILPESVHKRFRFNAAPHNTFHWEWDWGECFAYKGMTQMGMIDGYRCGVMYRIECWLETLGIKYSIAPRIETCMMHEQGACAGEIRVFPAGKAYPFE